MIEKVTGIDSRDPRSGSSSFLSSWLPPTSSKTPHTVIFCLIGLVGGMFGGLLGIGGGSVIAPLLLLVGTLRPAQVSGTTLTTVLVISTVGSGAYASLGHLNLELVWPIAMGSVAGKEYLDAPDECHVSPHDALFNVNRIRQVSDTSKRDERREWKHGRV